MQSAQIANTPTDQFKFHIKALFCLYDSNSDDALRSLTTLTHSCQEIACQTFSQEGQDFLWSHLSHPNIPSGVPDAIIPSIMSSVQQLFDNNLAFAIPSDSGYRVFHVQVFIIVDNEEYDDVMQAMMEESAQDFRMIPASKNAIHSLKKVKVTKLDEYCPIFMEEFVVRAGDNGGKAVSAMPCDHVFHQRCIVQWLQTSHMCPLCRYPMPIASNI
ncbi:E3 ubiquitin-protein ligase RING1-like [Gastrolobium bilobum]|uniref:E3 ubiquitin-protein ligase RING1-like n=1 Tax=Gastrolobium bilobum TaxID=150636 RepID=UPI002AB11FF9|nr:E3 ubiquitin-protein ligase RING1-like [Gastrolobium bilobum]